jgi:hypothetical protein
MDLDPDPNSQINWIRSDPDPNTAFKKEERKVEKWSENIKERGQCKE